MFQCLCSLIVSVHAQLQGGNLLSSVTNTVASVPSLTSHIGQQFFQALQSLTSLQPQRVGSGSQEFSPPSQRNYVGPPNLARVGGSQTGVLQQQSGNSGFQQGNGRPPQQPGVSGSPPPPVGGQQQRPGLGNNQQQQQQSQQQNIGQQSGLGVVQAYIGPVQSYSYNYEQNNLGGFQFPSNYEHFGSYKDHNDDNDQHVEYQQYNNFFQFGNNDQQDYYYLDSYQDVYEEHGEEGEY